MFGIKSPKDITSIKATYNTWLCPPGFSAITLFGRIYSRSKRVVERFNKTDGFDTVTEYHEFIHVKQAQNTFNSWLCFYVLYIWQWLMNLPLIFLYPKAAYRFIPFEMEAYAYQKDWDYVKDKDRGCYGWKSYNKLSLHKKWKYAKIHKRIGGDFGYFLLYDVNKEEGIV